MKVPITCNWCGKTFYRYPSQLKGKQYFFCSRKCLASFSSKTKNPTGYDRLKDYSSISRHMSQLNHEMNPMRMNMSVREKLRNSHLKDSDCVFYPKLYGRHEHRRVAEMILGRPLKKCEVVHHVDRNINNNSPNNLMIFKSQSDHAKYHAEMNKFFYEGDMTPLNVEEVMPDEVHST